MSPEILHIFTVGAVILSLGVVVSAVVGYAYDLDKQKEFILMLLVPTVAAPTYVADIPVDPRIGSASSTGYYINETAEGRVVVGACEPEQDAVIEVTR